MARDVSGRALQKIWLRGLRNIFNPMSAIENNSYKFSLHLFLTEKICLPLILEESENNIEKEPK